MRHLGSSEARHRYRHQHYFEVQMHKHFDAKMDLRLVPKFSCQMQVELARVSTVYAFAGSRGEKEVWVGL